MSYSISQIAQKFGFSAHTLRYYDKEGLLPFLERTNTGVRKFNESDLEWLSTISFLKSTGMPVKQIRQFINLCMQGDSTLEQRYRLFIEHKAAIQAEIAQLNESMAKIDQQIRSYGQALEKQNDQGALH